MYTFLNSDCFRISTHSQLSCQIS